jgi:hypothetical protein
MSDKTPKTVQVEIVHTLRTSEGLFITKNSNVYFTLRDNLGYLKRLQELTVEDIGEFGWPLPDASGNVDLYLYDKARDSFIAAVNAVVDMLALGFDRVVTQSEASDGAIYYELGLKAETV